MSSIATVPSSAARRLRALGPWASLALASAVLLTALLATHASVDGLPLRDALAGEQRRLFAITAVIVSCAALISGAAGFGFAPLGGSVLGQLLLDPIQAMQIVLASSILTQSSNVWQLRRAVHWEPLRPFIAGGLPGVVAGAAVLSWVTRAHHSVAYLAGLGAFLVAYAAYRLLRPRPVTLRAGRRHDALAGFVCGLMAGLAAMPGPPMAAWCSMRGWDALHQRATFQPFILATQMLSLVALGGLSGPATLSASALGYSGFALAASFAGVALFRRMSNVHFDRLVCTLLLVSGATLLAHAV